MMLRPFALASMAALGLAAPLFAQSTTPLPAATTKAEAAAQYQQGYNWPRSPDATGSNPGTTRLNTAVAVGTTRQLEGNAEAEAQYANDMQSYANSLSANGQTTARDQARYDNQRRAYADAMFAWRLQVKACERGHVKACNAPTPNPADYY